MLIKKVLIAFSFNEIVEEKIFLLVLYSFNSNIMMLRYDNVKTLIIIRDVSC